MALLCAHTHARKRGARLVAGLVESCLSPHLYQPAPPPAQTPHHLHLRTGLRLHLLVPAPNAGASTLKPLPLPPAPMLMLACAPACTHPYYASKGFRIRIPH